MLTFGNLCNQTYNITHYLILPYVGQCQLTVSHHTIQIHTQHLTLKGPVSMAERGRERERWGGMIDEAGCCGAMRAFLYGSVFQMVTPSAE